MPPASFKTLIVIPAFNEAGHLPALLEQVEERKDQVLVIDDGSTDNTVEGIREKGFFTLSHPENLGLTGVYETATEYAISHGFTHIISLDGDGQHDPGYLPAFLEALCHFDFVSGARFHHPDHVPETKIASNLFAILLFQEALGIVLPDAACGFRGWRVGQPVLAQKTFPDQLNSPYWIVFGMLFHHMESGKPVGFVNIPAIYHTSEPVTTGMRELSGLVSVIHAHRPSDTTAALTGYLSRKESFHLDLGGFRFEVRLETPDACRFIRHDQRARDFFRSLHQKSTHEHQG